MKALELVELISIGSVNSWANRFIRLRLGNYWGVEAWIGLASLEVAAKKEGLDIVKAEAGL